MPYGIVGKRKPPKSSLEARRKYGEGKMYEQCFSMELKTIEKTLCLCRKPGPSSGNPAKGKEVMNKASEEARFHRRWPGEEPDPAPAPGLLSPDSEEYEEVYCKR